jgi:hypothetical protein
MQTSTVDDIASQGQLSGLFDGDPPCLIRTSRGLVRKFPLKILKFIDQANGVMDCPSFASSYVRDHAEEISYSSVETSFFVHFAQKSLFGVLSMINTTPGKEPHASDFRDSRGANQQDLVVSHRYAVGADPLTLSDGIVRVVHGKPCRD